MTDLTYLNPPVELLATSPRQEMLAGRMKAHGLRPIPVGEAWTDNSRMPILVDIGSVSSATLERLELSVLNGLDRTVILLSPAEATGVNLHDCLFLHGDDEIASLSARLELRRRRETRANETSLRRETARQLNGLDEYGAPEGQATGTDILYLGDSGQSFQLLKHSFKQRGHDLIAALSVTTAESYLASGRFALVCLNATGAQTDVIELMERIALGQIMMASPIALITDAPHLLRDPTYLDVADEVVAASEPNDAIISACLGAMAKGLPSVAPNRVRLSSVVFDAHTKLYSETFLRTHLDEQIKVCSRLEAPLCMLSLRINPSLPANQRAKQVKRLASIVTGDLRVTDLAARAGATEIIITLRETPYAGAVKLARRLVARVQQACTPTGAPDFSWRIAECRATQTADTLIQSALSGAFMRVAAA
ncbi:MAG: hypothetical protein AAF253_02030 [Pseudomonadota bacterium]